MLTENNFRQGTNAAGRQNAHICLDSVRKHGVPCEEYSFSVHHGVLEIATAHDLLRSDSESLRSIHLLSEA